MEEQDNQENNQEMRNILDEADDIFQHNNNVYYKSK